MTPSRNRPEGTETIPHSDRAAIAQGAMRRCWAMTGTMIAVTGLALVAACAPVPTTYKAPPAPKPAPTPAPVPAPSAIPAPAQAPAVPQYTIGQWLDVPVTSGTWAYRADGNATRALFAAPATGTQFTMACERGNRVVKLWRALPKGIAAPTTMTVATSSTTRTLPATVLDGPVPQLVATLAPTDPILDAMIFSRGRFAVAANGTSLLVMPAWAEIARTVQDCR